MAGVRPEDQPGRDPKAINRGDGVMDVADWLREEDEAANKAEATRRANESHIKTSKQAKVTIAGTTIVKGRPTTISAVGTKSTKSPEPTPEVDLGGRNWVGLLQEYRQAHPSLGGLDYTESSLGLSLFICTVTLGESPEPLGNPEAIFSRKKDAKQNAAKLAVEWLIANNHMPSTDSVTFPKPPPTVIPKAVKASTLLPASLSAIQLDNAGPTSPSGVSYGQQVAEMCGRLGLPPPTYTIVPHKDFPAMYSGYASFGDSPHITGRVGEFENEHGRKNAKETCAQGVLRFLESLKEQRMKMAEGLGKRSWNSGVERDGSDEDINSLIRSLVDD